MTKASKRRRQKGAGGRWRQKAEGAECRRQITTEIRRQTTAKADNGKRQNEESKKANGD
jgi:hypothetical protein